MSPEVDIGEIRELAKKFSVEQIEACIAEEVGTGKNVCVRSDDAEAVVNELAKAEFVRGMTDGGMSLADALRELARRMRLAQRGFEQ